MHVFSYDTVVKHANYNDYKCLMYNDRINVLYSFMYIVVDLYYISLSVVCIDLYIYTYNRSRKYKIFYSNESMRRLRRQYKHLHFDIQYIASAN